MKQSNRGKQNTLMTQRRTVMQAFGMLVAAFTVLFASALSPAFAATGGSTTASGPGNGMRISPVRSELTINPGQTVTEDVYIQNITSQPATLQVLINDFTASGDESGSPALLLNNSSAPSHGLRQYIAPVPNVTLKPGEQKDVKIVISIPSDAAGGGYFGAIRFAPASVSPTDKNLALNASVASLILVKVPGNIVDQMSIASFDARDRDHTRTIFTNSKNVDAVIRFQNEGNVQEQPVGKIVVKNMSGKIVGVYGVNNEQPRSNVLPDSIRKFTVHLTKIGSFGRFTMEANFGYGSSGQLLSATTTFYVVPIPLMVAGIVIIVILLVAAFEIPRMVRRYRRAVRRGGRY